MPPPQCKIYPLDWNKLAELKKQIKDLLKDNNVKVSDSSYVAPILLLKRRKDSYIYVLIIVR